MKPTTYITLCIFVLICIGLQSCKEEPREESISLMNASDEVIHVFGTYRRDDIHITPEDAFAVSFRIKEVKPGKTCSPIKVTYDDSEKDWFYKIIIFKEATMNKYTPEEMIEENIFDKRYSFTCEELEAMDFKIVYTGE